MTSNNLFSDVDFSQINSNISKESIFKYKDKYKNYIYGDSVLSIHNHETFMNDTLFLLRMINIFYSKKKNKYLNGNVNSIFSSENSDSDLCSDSDIESDSDPISDEKSKEYSDEIYDILNNSDSDSILSFKEEDLQLDIVDEPIENKAKEFIDNLDFEDIIINEISKIINMTANIRMHLLSKNSKNTIILINLLFKMISKVDDIEFIVKNNNNLLGEKEKYLKFILLIQNVSEFVNSHHITLQHYLSKIKEVTEKNSELTSIILLIDSIRMNYESLIHEERNFTQFKDIQINDESMQIVEKIIYLFFINIKDHEKILYKYTGKKFNYFNQ